MSSHSPTHLHLGSRAAHGSTHWQLLPAHSPVQRHQLCSLAQPSLKSQQYTPGFYFHEATLLLITSGTLQLTCEQTTLEIGSSDSLLLVDAGTCAHLLKTPGEPDLRFRSTFMSFSPELIELFHRNRDEIPRWDNQTGFQQAKLDDELQSTLQRAYSSIEDPDLSAERLRYRLFDLLAGLAERGYGYPRVQSNHAAGRIRSFIAAAPDQKWTAHSVGQALAMSEATLRRRLALEHTKFEELLTDVRMHHALMLLQTTAWSISQVSEASGYKSRARFAERFRERFGYLPSTVRR